MSSRTTKTIKNKKELEELKLLAIQTIGKLKTKNHPNWSTPEKVLAWQKKLRAEWD